MTIEISFPRGGRKPPPDAKPRDFQRDHDLFGRERHKKTIKHAGKSNVFQEKDDTLKVENLHVEQLSTKTIQDGMILLGCVKEIQKLSLEISLPGRLWGQVFVNNISKPYTKLLQTLVDKNEADGYKQLEELFILGQCVAVKVLNLNDEKYGITLSMMPQQVNANISHKSVKTGMTLWGAISEVEDHGYVVDFGINNCRAFLRKENCDLNRNYDVGELLWVSVIKADTSSTATTVTLSAKKEKVRNTKILDGISLDHLLPGMQLDFTISEVLSNGLEGKFFNDYTGYVDIGQLTKSIHDNNEYEPDKVIQARILYMMPVTKIAYFTLRSLEPHKTGKIKDGDIMKCKILGVTPFGIYIKFLKNKSIGFVSLYRALKDVSHNENMSDYSYLKRRYPKQSHQQCRVLNYDYFEQIYICSMERELINKDIIFSLNNVEAGQEVSAEIEKIQPNGLVVKIQHVYGFIKNEHICDTVLKNYNNIKARLKVGQTIQARVWVINQEKHALYLTMRPSLVNTEFVLKDYEYAKVNQQLLGVIRQVGDKGLLVQFFGDVHGWVPIKKIVFGVQNLDTLFKTGQLVKCTIVNCNKKKLTLSLQSSTEITEDIQPELKLGEHVDGIVSHVTNEGVHVTVNTSLSDITAFIPILYTSKFPKLAPIIAKMYQPGDEISNLVCVSKNDALPTLSLRDSELNVHDIKNIKTLEMGTILPCSVSTTDSFSINVEAPIENFKKTVYVPKENLSDQHEIPPSMLKLNQQIYAKVFNVSKNFEAVTASTKLSDVWDYDVQSSIQYFSEYLKDVLRIREHFKLLKNPLACLNLGEKVSGVIISVNDNDSSTVQLENGIRAIVQPEHTKENLSIKDKVEGVVLFWNFVDNVAEITLCPKLISRINQLQNAVINIPAGVTNKSNAHAEVILIRDDFVLGVLRGAAGKRQLIFFPSRLHANDLKPDLSAYVIGDYINVQVSKNENGIIIGLLKQLVRDLDSKRRKNFKNKRKSDNNSEQTGSKRVKLENSNDKDNKKDKKKKQKKPDISGNNSEDEIETIVKIKQNKSPKKNDEEMKEISKSKKNKQENTINTLDNEVMVETNKIKKERKKINSISSEEENMNTIVEKKKNKAEKQKKRKLDKDYTSEIQTNIKEVIKKSEQNLVIEQKKNKTNNQKKQKLDKDDISDILNSVTKEKKNKTEEQKKRKLDDDDPEQNPVIENDIPAVLPGADNFWNIQQEPENIVEESSDDEPEQKELEQQKKKKKMTPAEKAEAARLEEERIRKIEIELADTATIPKTADQFERLVLANPNNSMLWINYMAFHLEATEIEKARTIARKALSTIDFREEQEKLNIWIAFLNLENRYGTKESFAGVLEEAVKMNDSLSVYLQALNILSESKKTVEFLELLRIVSRKFKQEYKMWTGTAEACYKNDLKEAARDLMQRSLKSLDEKQHINILVQFAFMEARHNEPERAEALLEKVLASYPRRVDVWTSYIDMLIKGNRIHIARNVLERAVGQKLPARKMKTIFTKYVQFETKYGDEESVKKVRQLAAQYVKTALK